MRNWLQACISRPLPLCCGCTRPIREDAYLTGLCGDCVRHIPWIRTFSCPRCGRPQACEDCQRRRTASSPLLLNRSAVSYTPAMKVWLAGWKYGGDERWAKPMAQMLDLAFQQTFGNAVNGKRVRIDLISPVPLSTGRLQERGFNQAELLAQFVAKRQGIRYAPLLQRVKDTERQSQKSRQERISSLHGAFALAPAGGELLQRSEGKWHILLIDDVYTTGTTLDECAKTLQAATSCRVAALTWAR